MTKKKDGGPTRKRRTSLADCTTAAQRAALLTPIEQRSPKQWDLLEPIMAKDTVRVGRWVSRKATGVDPTIKLRRIAPCFDAVRGAQLLAVAKAWNVEPSEALFRLVAMAHSHLETPQ